MPEKEYRMENDSMGRMEVPAGALWGAQTQRAVLNFPVSGVRFPRCFIRALGLLKKACAAANVELGLLDRKLGGAVEQAAGEVSEGVLDEHFVIDIYQTGSGTSTNMNANEVIANRANVLLGGRVGTRSPVHPNDHVNMGQSSNDIIPSTMHIAAAESVSNELKPALEELARSFREKERAFHGVVKIGRTHFQDAVPVRLGQEFGGYGSITEHALLRVGRTEPALLDLALGGTAVGTGINTHPRFAGLAISRINTMTGLEFREAGNHFEAQSAKDALVDLSGVLKGIAVSMIKITNDIRFLSSGPRCGIGEIILPEVQPGSSIMPGKVNPVMAESLCQAAARVMGNDTAISLCGILGHLELNVMMPLLAHALLESIQILAAGVGNFSERCVKGLKADENKIRDMVGKSLALCTALSPVIGYDEAASIAKEAYKTGKSVREVAGERNLLAPEELDRLLDPESMT